MRQLHGAFLLLPALLGAQTITYGPLVSNITHSTARVTFVTSSDPQNSDIVYSRPGGQDRTVSAVRNGSAPFTSTVVLTGLSPA
ncbi:MAG TPA: hypothetical protein DEH78_27215, partial [Solibacterales bacterium]|nr:hypothetical protein [Bryobacterales bacterium]